MLATTKNMLGVYKCSDTEAGEISGKMLIEIKILDHIQQTRSSELIMNFVVTNTFQHYIFFLT